MSDLPFGLESQKTYASMSPADLQSLGKRASVAYLSGGISLNDAIVKLAREYPSISPHQVQRVVEFANQETFAKLFSDGEKYASDKNIEFDVADPSDILLELNNGARPTVMSVPPDEYSSSPVKLAHSNAEADVELARIFGVDPALPGSEMTVKYAQHEDGHVEVLERILTKEASIDPLDRILESGQEKTAINPFWAMPAAGAAVGGATGALTAPEGKRLSRGLMGAGAGAALGTAAGLGGSSLGGAAGWRVGRVAKAREALKAVAESPAGLNLQELEAAEDALRMSERKAGRMERVGGILGLPVGVLGGGIAAGRAVGAPGVRSSEKTAVDPIAAMAKKYNMDPWYLRRYVWDPSRPGSFEHDVAYESHMQQAEGKGPGVKWNEKKWGYPHPGTPTELKPKHANLVDGIAAQPAPTPQPSPQEQMQQMVGGQPGTRASASGDTHNDQMLELQREIELAKKRQELQKVEQQTIDQMNPQGQPGAVQAPLPGGGPGPDAGAAAAPPEAQGGPVEMAPMPPEPGQEQVPPEQVPPAAGAITAPPGAEATKMSSALLKEAMVHVKSGRPHDDLLLGAVESSVSLGSIKQAVAGRGEYPMANPWGDVIRSKQKLAKLLEDATYARGKTVELYKEAEVRFEHMLGQHLHDGGNLGEVGHLMAAVNSSYMKTVLASAVAGLIPRGLDPVKAKAEAIQYEMEKGAGVRTPNLDHPLAGAYATLCKLADALPVLEAARSQLKERYDLGDKALQEAMVNASAR